MKKEKKERSVFEMLEDCNNLYLEVARYIHNTPHCIFYWISNDEVKDYINEYPEDYEDHINVVVDSFEGSSVTVRIEFDRDHPHNVDHITRFCHLPTFRKEVELNYTKFNGSVIDLKIKELEQDLGQYEGWVEETKKKLDVLYEEKKKQIAKGDEKEC